MFRANSPAMENVVTFSLFAVFKPYPAIRWNTDIWPLTEDEFSPLRLNDHSELNLLLGANSRGIVGILIIDVDLADSAVQTRLVPISCYRGQHLADTVHSFCVQGRNCSSSRVGIVAQCLAELWRAVRVHLFWWILGEANWQLGPVILVGHLCPGPQWDTSMPKLRGLHKIWLNYIELHTEHTKCM